MRREYIPSLQNEKYVAEFLNKGDFDILVIYPSRFGVSAAPMKPEHRFGGARTTQGRGPRLVFSTAEVLDAPMRRQIEDYFQAPVFNFYGMMEFGAIAWECASHRGFHINIDALVLEIVRKETLARPGEKGRIVATGLHSYAMPFIRYDTEDVGILSRRRCPCGRGLPLLERLEGRCDDLISLANGTVLPTSFSLFLRDLKGIRQYRVVQEEIDKLTVYLVLQAKAPSDLVERVKKQIRPWVGETMAIRVKIVDEIPPDPSGKLRAVISYVPVNF
jgi:phenylacetate-CoA ligase